MTKLSALVTGHVKETFKSLKMGFVLCAFHRLIGGNSSGPEAPDSELPRNFQVKSGPEVFNKSTHRIEISRSCGMAEFSDVVCRHDVFVLCTWWTGKRLLMRPTSRSFVVT